MKKIFVVLGLVVMMMFVVSCAPTGQAYQFEKKSEKVPPKEKIELENKIPKVITCPKSIILEQEQFVTKEGELFNMKEPGTTTAVISIKHSKDKNGVLWGSWGPKLYNLKERTCFLFSSGNGVVNCEYEPDHKGSYPTFYEINANCPNAKKHTDDSCECS